MLLITYQNKSNHIISKTFFFLFIAIQAILMCAQNTMFITSHTNNLMWPKEVQGKERKGMTAGYRVGETLCFNPGARSLLPICNRVAINMLHFSCLLLRFLCATLMEWGGGGKWERATKLGTIIIAREDKLRQAGRRLAET